MSEKRKDSKGRVLRTGESQRKDLNYQYRYTDVTGRRRTLARHYAPCAAAYLLYQHGQCGNGPEKLAALNGPLRCRGHHECVHPHQLRSGGGSYAKSSAHP